MGKRVPIGAAKQIVEVYGQSQVVIVTFDKDGGGITQVITYGRTVEECKQAAQGGNFVKRALGWPESLCHAKPTRAKKPGVCAVCKLPRIDCLSWGKDTESHRA